MNIKKIVLCFLLAIQLFYGYANAKETENLFLHLNALHFDPLKMKSDNEYLKNKKISNNLSSEYYIIQFNKPITKMMKDILINQGIEIYDYIPEFAFIIKSKDIDLEFLRKKTFVRWIGKYRPEYKISKKVLHNFYINKKKYKEMDSLNLRITLFPFENIEEIKAELLRCGAKVENIISTKWKTSIFIKISYTKIKELSEIRYIKWIENTPKCLLYNDVASDILNVKIPRQIYNLYGEDQIIAVCDTGLDQGYSYPEKLHDDFEDGLNNSRVKIFDLVGDGASDVNSGHGTHVAGSIVGNGFLSGCNPLTNEFSNNCHAGIAPKANLIFQSIEDNKSKTLLGLLTDLNEIFQKANDSGAKIHSNSWGSNTHSMYNTHSQDLDEFVWENPDFLIFVAAGNEGKDSDSNGIIDLYSMSSPATSKNCISIGGCESKRPVGQGYGGGYNDLINGNFLVDPIKNDHVSDNPDGMAAFSSRGPVLDGRYKPDLIAPATNILSTRSSLSSYDGWGLAPDENYIYMGGTSMATPLAAGTAALLREYLIKEKGFILPSAALIKAALMNSAVNIYPGQYKTKLFQEISDSKLPNNVTGWGRINLGAAIYPETPYNIIYFDQTCALNTGDYTEYTFSVNDESYPLKINLVWTDYPGAPQSQGGLVNDLDLMLTDPLNNKIYPDNACKKSSIQTIAYDINLPLLPYHINNTAVKFTPEKYPTNVESVSFLFNNPDSNISDVSIVIYDDNGNNDMPGDELLRKKLNYIPTGWITVGFSDIVISEGSFYIAVEIFDESQSLTVDIFNTSKRAFMKKSSKWTESFFFPYIRANVRNQDYQTNFDRVNNAVGIQIQEPISGIYTINISGYNIPFGPQKFALVLSGAISQNITDTISENIDINRNKNVYDFQSKSSFTGKDKYGQARTSTYIHGKAQTSIKDKQEQAKKNTDIYVVDKDELTFYNETNYNNFYYKKNFNSGKKANKLDSVFNNKYNMNKFIKSQSINNKPKIIFTQIPPYGNKIINIKGFLNNINCDDYYIAVYIYIDGWYSRPYLNKLKTQINPDNTFICDITTGYNDHIATMIAVFVFDNFFDPVALNGEKSINESIIKKCNTYAFHERGRLIK